MSPLLSWSRVPDAGPIRPAGCHQWKGQELAAEVLPHQTAQGTSPSRRRHRPPKRERVWVTDCDASLSDLDYLRVGRFARHLGALRAIGRRHPSPRTMSITNALWPLSNTFRRPAGGWPATEPTAARREEEATTNGLNSMRTALAVGASPAALDAPWAICWASSPSSCSLPPGPPGLGDGGSHQSGFPAQGSVMESGKTVIDVTGEAASAIEPHPATPCGLV